MLRIGRFCPKQLPDPGDIGRAIAVAVKAIVTDAVLISGEHVDQEPADERICGQCHGGVAAHTFETVIFDAESNTTRIETDQAAVGYCHPVRVTRQIRQYGLWSCEGFFGKHDPVDLAQWFEEGVEDIPIIKVSMIAKDVQLPSLMQLGQPFQNEPSVKTGQQPHRQEEVFRGGDPFAPSVDKPPPGTIMWTWGWCVIADP